MPQNQIHAIINEQSVTNKIKRKCNPGKQEKELNRFEEEEEERDLARELDDRKFMSIDLVIYKIGDNGKPIYIKTNEFSIRNMISIGQMTSRLVLMY